MVFNNSSRLTYNSPQETVQNAQIAIAIVTGDRASREIWLNQTTGAINGLKPNTTVMEFSTLTPSWCQELAREINQHNCNFLDAPVVGSRPQAEASQLIYLVGGQAYILNQQRPKFCI
ncbi:3-hydroxyisobutyrate dehydrogenase (fragment) [Hyella patelloides LEGE 07179]|uniref:3-hydroxyisobutyrate dehydrogenase n=1 Tax=Hyella patelloides LEGE 07179 TaxID=945734 RepID=A0A563VM67_9CYAN